MTQEEMDRAAHHLLMLSDDPDANANTDGGAGDGVATSSPRAPPRAPPRSVVGRSASVRQPLTNALSTVFNEVDEIKAPPRRNKS